MAHTTFTALTHSTGSAYQTIPNLETALNTLEGGLQAQIDALSGTVTFDPEAKTFETRTALSAATIAADVNVVVTRGYGAAGDGGGALYKRVGSEPAHPGKVSSNGGTVWWELVADYPSIRQFGAVGDGTTNDGTALANAISYADLTGRNTVRLDKGIFAIGATVAVPAQMAIIGVDDAKQTGSDRRASTLRWTGGASPIFTSAASYQTFKHFGVENHGTATTWLELNAGAIGNTYEDMTFVVPTGATAFSDSVIKSNGNRMGYSEFRHIVTTSPAPVFAKIDGQSTANGITPMFFDHIIAKASGTAFTFLQIIDEIVEATHFRNSHFIQADGTNQMKVLEATLTSPSIKVLSVENCEFDTNAAATVSHLFFDVANVDNARFLGNHINGNGRNFFARMDNSHVTEFASNYATSITEYIFDLNNGSTIRYGMNKIDWSGVKGIFEPVTAATAGLVKPTYGPSIQLRGDDLHGMQHGIYVIDVTNGSGYSIGLDVTRPGWMAPGQVFTVVVSNVSGGAISAPSFSASFTLFSTPAAPANGFQRSYTFYFNGSKAIQMPADAADVANA